MNIYKQKILIPNRYKQLIFKVIAAIMPIVLIFILEGCLRFFDYGHSLALFVEDKDYKDCWVANKYFSLRYFNDSTNATIGNFEPFKKIKKRGTVRIFIVGESTTIGFPYMHNGSFHRWLEYRLLQMYPETNFEIINLSLTAVTSFTVRDIAKDLVNYQPDAVFIYAGHNEYYGALGAASTSSFGENRILTNLLIEFKQYRLFQLLQSTYGHVFGGAKTADIRKTLMERMVKKPEIEFNSPVYLAGIKNFSRNIEETCTLLSKQHIPVFISTIVSNEKDLKPFISDNKKTAEKLFRQGQLSYANSQFSQAKYSFVAAKDQDLLRFRAPTAINQELLKIASANHQITLIDGYKLFEQNSPHLIIGNNFLLEHVHPNLDGYALLSEAFFNALYKSGILPRKASFKMTLTQLKKEMPITITDSVFGAYAIELLRKQWPFNEQQNLSKATRPEEMLAYEMAVNHLKWNDAMNKLMDYYQQKNDYEHMLKVAEAVLLEYPLDPTFYVVAGRLSIKTSDLIKGSNYFYRAFYLQPNLQLAQEIFALEVKQKHLSKALAMIEFGLTKTPENNRFGTVKQMLVRMIAIESEIDKHTISTRNPEMANCYKLLGEPTIAKYYE